MELLEEIDKKQTPILLANCFLNFGDYYSERLEIDSAFFYYDKAENFFLDEEKDICIGTIKVKKAIALFDVNDYINSEKYCLKALNYLRGHQALNVTKRFEAYITLGLIYKFNDNRSNCANSSCLKPRSVLKFLVSSIFSF